MTEALSKALQEVEVLIDRVQRLEATNTPQSTSTTKISQQKATSLALIASRKIDDMTCSLVPQVIPNVILRLAHA